MSDARLGRPPGFAPGEGEGTGCPAARRSLLALRRTCVLAAREKPHPPTGRYRQPRSNLRAHFRPVQARAQALRPPVALRHQARLLRLTNPAPECRHRCLRGRRPKPIFHHPTSSFCMHHRLQTSSHPKRFAGHPVPIPSISRPTWLCGQPHSHGCPFHHPPCCWPPCNKCGRASTLSQHHTPVAGLPHPARLRQERPSCRHPRSTEVSACMPCSADAGDSGLRQAASLSCLASGLRGVGGMMGGSVQ